MRLRTFLIVLAVVVVVPLAALGVFLATFDPNTYKPRITEAVQAATGRALRLSGPIHVKPALVPTLAIADVGFANAPWGSRPEMATIGRLEARVALLPLLHGELRIAEVVLVDPDILLERRADGQANWMLTPPAVAPAPAAATTPSAPAAPAAGTTAAPAASAPAIALDSLRIDGGRLALRDAVLNRADTIALQAVQASAPGGDGALRLQAAATWNGVAFTVDLRGGPLAQLLRPTAGGPPWPLSLKLDSAVGHLAVQGRLASPVTGAGYDLAVEGAVAALSRLAPFVPDVPLPPLNGVTFSLEAADRGGAVPELRALSLKIGESDLNAFHPGLVLRRAEVAAKAADQPLTFAAEASAAGVPLKAEGTTGPLAALLAGPAPSAPWPVRLAAAAGTATLTLEGTLARPAEAAGLDARIVASAPDLAQLAPLVGRSLPAIREAKFSAHLVEHARRNGYALKEIAASVPGSDLTGEASLLLAARSRIEAELASRRLDIDALLAAMPAPLAGAPGGAAPPAAPPARASQVRPSDGRMIPDTPLPLEPLKLVDARLALAVGELTFGATAYRDLAATLTLAGGHLEVQGLKATLPSGALSGALDIDAGKATPPVALRLRAPGLELASLLPRLGVPFPMKGALEVDLDVKGAGSTPRAVAATLDGHLGLAIGRGSIDSRLLELAGGELWRLLVPGAPRGDTAITCLAVRFDAAGGLATARALLFDTAPARISGEGSVNLGTERLALVLRPTLRLAGGGISVPLDVGGTFAAPSYRPDPAGALGALGAVAGGAAAGAGQGAMVGGPLGAIVGGIVGAARQGAGEAAGGDCPAALAIARGGRAAPAEAPAPSAAPATPPAAPAAPSAPPAQSAPAPSRPASPIPGVRLPRLPF